MAGTMRAAVFHDKGDVRVDEVPTPTPEPFAAGIGDHTLVTTLCPGGKERALPGDRPGRDPGGRRRK
jgi:hypothetical protein